MKLHRHSGHRAVAMALVVIIMCFNFVTVATGLTWKSKDDRICDPGHKSRLFPYTGFRLSRQYTHTLSRAPVLHHQRLTHCNAGHVDGEAYLPVERNQDIAWGQTMCMPNGGPCYRVVRNKKYAHRLISLYVPFTVIGGLFQCPAKENCTNDNAYPILPLISDNLSHQWNEFRHKEGSRWIHRVPYFYTPSILDYRYPRRPDRLQKWAKALDVDENYNYTVLDKIKLVNAFTRLVNVIHHVVFINANVLPWDVDMVVKELEKDFATPNKSIDVLAYLLPVFKKMAPQSVDEIIRLLQTPIDELEFEDPEIYHPMP